MGDLFTMINELLGISTLKVTDFYPVYILRDTEIDITFGIMMKAITGHGVKAFDKNGLFL